jgi:hypothetical protein
MLTIPTNYRKTVYQLKASKSGDNKELFSSLSNLYPFCISPLILPELYIRSLTDGSDVGPLI